MRTVAPKQKEKKNLIGLLEFKPYYQHKDFTLFNADSIAFLSSLPEDSIDMIFADPPYNLSNGGFSVYTGRRVSVNKGEWDRSE